MKATMIHLFTNPFKRNSITILILFVIFPVVFVYLCEEEEFFNPYVRIKTKKGETFSSIYSSGFLDLSKIFGALICINGPAVLYTAAKQNKNNNISSDDIHVYDKGYLNIYTHRCLPFNELTPESYRKYKKMRRKPNLFDQHVKIRGLKVYGVTLVSKENDYRQSEIYQFNQPLLAYSSKNETAIGSSFVVVGNSNCWCTNLPKRHPREETHNIIICTEAKSKFEVCNILGGRQDAFSILFTSDFISDRQYTWMECETKNKLSEMAGLHVFQPFSLNAPENPFSLKLDKISSSKANVKHHWEVKATNCIQFPTYMEGAEC